LVVSKDTRIAVDNKTFILENIDWHAKNPMKISRFSPKDHLWYVQLPNNSMKTFTHEEYEFYLSVLKKKLRG